MKNTLSKGLMLGLMATVFTMPAIAQDQTKENFGLTGYRIDTNDCFGCGPDPEMNSVADLADFLSDTRAVLEGEGGSEGVFVSNSTSPANTERRALRRTDQVVFLDFDAGGLPTFPVCNADGSVFGVFQDHVFTQAERDEITARIAADYADYNFTITQEEPASGDFTTVFFGQNDFPLDCSGGSNITVTATGGVSILFGQAEGIDFLNADRTDNAFTDISIWEFLVQLDPSGGLLSAFTTIDLADFEGDVTAALSSAIVTQGANTGAHEAGHLLGLRHQNSFGAPGQGLPSTGAIGPDEFVPVFDGPSNATETVLHTMASGASVGLTLAGSTITDRFFSERSAVRLAVNEQGFIDTEEATSSRRDTLRLRNIRTPNTIIEGQNADARIRVRGVVLEGTLDVAGEVDSYFIRGKKGEFFNAEIIPVIVTGESFVEGIFGQVSIFQQNRDGSETLIATNSQSFESIFDTEIFDAVLPANGVYRVQIAAPDSIDLDIDGDGIPDTVPLSLVGGADLLAGNYKVLMFTCDKRLPFGNTVVAETDPETEPETEAG